MLKRECESSKRSLERKVSHYVTRIPTFERVSPRPLQTWAWRKRWKNSSNLGIGSCLCGRIWEWLEGTESMRSGGYCVVDRRLEKWSPQRSYRDRGCSHAPVLCITVQCVASTSTHQKSLSWPLITRTSLLSHLYSLLFLFLFLSLIAIQFLVWNFDMSGFHPTCDYVIWLFPTWISWVLILWFGFNVGIFAACEVSFNSQTELTQIMWGKSIDQMIQGDSSKV